MGETTQRRALVVGASSGIGEALALALASSDYHTAVVARRRDRLEAVAARMREQGRGGMARAYAHDVRETHVVADLFGRIASDLGGLDAFFWVAGVMERVAPDEYDTARDRVMIETNLMGAIAWLNEAARHFAAARQGRIVGISSMAGERGRRAAPVYGASKAGLNTYLESLRNRLEPLGVHVLTVKPGFVATAMLEGRHSFWVSTPEAAALQILRASESARHEIFVTRRWRLVSWALRAMPSFLLRRLPF
ncbi:MAG: SDR family NAD(P)-dependent oxidoreductase [Myxococcota bacterium]